MVALHDDDGDDRDDGLLKVSIEVCNRKREENVRSKKKHVQRKRSNCVNIEGFQTIEEKKRWKI